jgi:transcriptional regulator with XRE-family HTH domain
MPRKQFSKKDQYTIHIVAQKMGKRMKQLRSHLGLSQVEISKNLSISVRQWSGCECGDYLLNIDFLILLNTYYQVSIDWLLTGKGTMFIDDIYEPEQKITSQELAEELKNLLERLED